MEGTLPPDLQGTLLRIGPRSPWAHHTGRGGPTRGAGGRSRRRSDRAGGRCRGRPSDGCHPRPGVPATAWPCRTGGASPTPMPGSSGKPGQCSRCPRPACRPSTPACSSTAGVRRPAVRAHRSHVPRVAADGSRVLFSVDDRAGTEEGAAGLGVDGGAEQGIWLRIGEWDAGGTLRGAQAVELERATWQHDVAVTSRHVVFIESPTTRLVGPFGCSGPFRLGARSRGLAGRRPPGQRRDAGALVPSRPVSGHPRARRGRTRPPARSCSTSAATTTLEAGRPSDPALSVVGRRASD